MTRDETIQILMMVQAAYPNYKPSDKTVAINTWNLLLSEYSYSQVESGLRAYILSDTSGFAPSIGQLIAKVKTIEEPAQLNESEAWGLVSKAIRNGYYGAVEEFSKLPPLVQKAVGTPQQLKIWACDSEFNENVVSSNFIKTYRTEVKRATELNKMPSDVKKLIEMVNTNSVSAQIASENKKAISLSLEDKKAEETGKMGVRNSVPMPEKYKKEFGIE